MVFQQACYVLFIHEKLYDWAGQTYFFFCLRIMTHLIDIAPRSLRKRRYMVYFAVIRELDELLIKSMKSISMMSKRMRQHLLFAFLLVTKLLIIECEKQQCVDVG